MNFKLLYFLVVISLFSCQPKEELIIDENILHALGNKHRTEFSNAVKLNEQNIDKDSTNVDALLGYAQSQIYLYIFGFESRDQTIPLAKQCFTKAQEEDPTNPKVISLSAIIHLLDWNWKASESDFKKAIHSDPTDLGTRHWYSLYLSAMGKFDEAMLQSDTIMTMDPDGNYLVGRGSLYYFARQNEDLKQLMKKTVKKDTLSPWAYDWLGMAYVELKDFDNSINTYFKAFELADGTVEVGAGLGHALGLAGEYKLAKQMADYYEEAAKNNYLPQVQRAFIHIGISEYDKAIELLEQAYDENSWFLAFIQVEPWYDPIRNDKRFTDIMDRMKFPKE